ncbi:helix-turn-helix domain-containing protein [Aquimarina macrocephali]|uniref:helix-turn-helix domain-containing protein n=1 Tax=Aquimarina macrocephali TaxID=666563 RepID=UPI003F67045E
MENPFDTLLGELGKINNSLNYLINRPKEDKSDNLYTVKEAAEIFKVDTQTIRNHIEKGTIQARKIGSRILIAHTELYNSLDEVKSLRYKR